MAESLETAKKLEIALADDEYGKVITFTSSRPILGALNEVVTDNPKKEDEIESLVDQLVQNTHDRLMTFPLVVGEPGTVLTVDIEEIAKSAENDKHYWTVLNDAILVIGGLAAHLSCREVTGDNPLVLRAFKKPHGTDSGLDFLIVADLLLKRQASIALQSQAELAMNQIAGQLTSYGGTGYYASPRCLIGDDKRSIKLAISANTQLRTDNSADEDELPLGHERGVLRLIGNNITHPAHPLVFLAGLVAITN